MTALIVTRCMLKRVVRNTKIRRNTKARRKRNTTAKRRRKK